jgi:hypothetical protein
MSILVYPYNEQEEKILLEFLESRHYNYRATDESGSGEPSSQFLDQYNKELEDADAQIDAGDYISHDDVKKFLAERRKRIGGN